MLCAGVPVIFGVLTTDNLEQVSMLLYFFLSFVDFACLCDLWCADDRQPGAVENDP